MLLFKEVQPLHANPWQPESWSKNWKPSEATIKDIKRLQNLKLLNSLNLSVNQLLPRHLHLAQKKPRGRRQAPSYPITNLSSVARRGSLDQNGYHYLCTEWSAITTLSADYFPRYLNEVICDAKDVGCLSYEGICVQDSFIVNVLRNTGKCGSDGKQIWEVVSQPVRSCCSCRLFQGSFLGKYLWHFHFGLGLFSTPHKLYISVTSGVPSGALKWKINRSQQKFLK